MEEVNLKPSRLAKRASYDSEQIYSILDEGLVCQVAYVENGKPMMIPTGYCRIEDKLYIHGSVGSHFMRSLADGREVCLSVSLLDGLGGMGVESAASTMDGRPKAGGTS